MIRPVERFTINLAPRSDEPRPVPGSAGRAAGGPVGLLAAACLGVAGTLLAQRLAEDGELLGLLRSLLERLIG